MEIILTDRNYEYWIKGTKNYERFGVLDEMNFLDMFIPNILNNDKYILRGIQDVDNKYNDKVNILLCVENLSVKERRHYSHRNSYGMYGNKCIKIYLYNHISKIVKTDDYIAIPIIYLQISYYLRKYEIIKPVKLYYSDKHSLCLITSKNTDKNVLNSIRSIQNKGNVSNIMDVNKNIKSKSCYHSQELIDLFSGFKFVYVCENSLENGYITEKIFNVFFSRCIPIYYGPDDTSRYFNDKVYIDARKPDYMCKINRLLNDEKLYNECIEMNKINDSYNDENYVGQLSEWLH